MSQDDRELQNELYGNGTLCYSCGNLNNDLVKEDKILGQAPGKIYLCKECKGNE